MATPGSGDVECSERKPTKAQRLAKLKSVDLYKPNLPVEPTVDDSHGTRSAFKLAYGENAPLPVLEKRAVCRPETEVLQGYAYATDQQTESQVEKEENGVKFKSVTLLTNHWIPSGIGRN